MKSLINTLAIAACLLGLNACFYDNPPDLVPFDCTEVSYGTHVQPILDAKCATSGCHDGQYEPNLLDGVSWNNLVAGGYVNTEIPEISLLYKTVIFEESPMPPGGPKLSDLDIELILCWISEGTPNN